MIILEKYLVNKQTLAIFPARAIEYQAIVWEGDKTYYVRKTPSEIIQHACIHIGFSSFKGKQLATKKHTKWKYKVPIAISIFFNIYAFPTRAISHFECSWIFNEHILYKRKSSSRHKSKTIIQFKNLREAQIDVSDYTISEQMRRTSFYKQYIEHQNYLFQNMAQNQGNSHNKAPL